MRIKGYRTKLTKGMLERSRIPRRFWGVNYSEVPASAQASLGKYIRSVDDMLDDGEGLLLWGPNGHGKTSIAVLVASEVMRRGGTAYFVTAESLRIAALEKTYFDDETTIMERAQEVELLIIDDLGKEHRGGSEWAERLLENVLRVRLANKRATIITTNLGLVGYDIGDEQKCDASDKQKQKRVPGLNTVYSTSMLEVLREALWPFEVKGENKRIGAAIKLHDRLAV